MYAVFVGEIICLDNERVMHGRVGFTLSKNGGRHLEVGYIDWDELRSMFRVLGNKIGLDHHLRSK